jgi:hypothetical protein
MNRLPGGRAWLSVIAVVSTLTGCSDPAETEAEAEIGTGMFSFAALPDGASLDLVSGPQGGFHFIVHARMRGLSPGDPQRPGLPDNPTTWFRALDENGARVDIPEVRQLGYAPQASGDDWYILPSGRILLIDNQAAPRLYGRPVTIEVQIRDASGRMAGDTARITAVAYPPAVDAGPADAAVDAGPPDAAAADAGPGSPFDAGSAPAAD